VPDARRREVLIATLGTQPAVVTVTLDLLLAQERPVDEVVVIHTASTHRPIKEALQRLRDEFPNRVHYAHANRPCRYQEIELTVEGRPFNDVRTAQEAGRVFTTIYQEVRRQKRKGHLIHLSIAGGRKSMSVYGRATAQLLFDADDRLWHLLSQSEFEASDAMHATSPDDAQLVRIPLLAYSSLSPPLATLLVTDDPLQAIEGQQTALRLEERRKQQEFIENVLTPLERRIMETLMREIILHHHSPNNAEIGRQLYLATRTIGNQLTRIYAKLREFLGLAPEEPVDRHVLIALFTPYFADHFAESP